MTDLIVPLFMMLGPLVVVAIGFWMFLEIMD